MKLDWKRCEGVHRQETYYCAAEDGVFLEVKSCFGGQCWDWHLLWYFEKSGPITAHSRMSGRTDDEASCKIEAEKAYEGILFWQNGMEALRNQFRAKWGLPE